MALFIAGILTCQAILWFVQSPYMVLGGHRRAVTALALHGSMLLSASSDRVVLWDLDVFSYDKEAGCTVVSAEDNAEVAHVEFNDDASRFLVCAGDDVFVYDIGQVSVAAVGAAGAEGGVMAGVCDCRAQP